MKITYGLMVITYVGGLWAMSMVMEEVRIQVGEKLNI